MYCDVYRRMSWNGWGGPIRSPPSTIIFKGYKVAPKCSIRVVIDFKRQKCVLRDIQVLPFINFPLCNATESTVWLCWLRYIKRNLTLFVLIGPNRSPTRSSKFLYLKWVYRINVSWELIRYSDNEFCKSTLSEYWQRTMHREPFLKRSKIVEWGAIQPPHLYSYNFATEMRSITSILSKKMLKETYYDVQ